MDSARLTMVLDVPLPRWQAACRFWAAATGWTVTEVRREEERFCTLIPPVGAPWVKMQAIRESAPRVHVDLGVPTGRRAAQQARAAALGGEVAWRYEDVVVMRSPGGLLLCHNGSDSADARLMRRGRTVLDQVCLDIPARCWDEEVSLWRGLTGRPLEQGAQPEYAFLGSADNPSGQPRILLQRLADDQPTVTAHPDFATADVRAEVKRHRSLGASVVAEHRWWTVMEAPGGHRYCLTGRDPVTGGVDPILQVPQG